MPHPARSTGQSPRRRERKHPCVYHFVRKVKGRGYQCRPWLPCVGLLNLGCFSDEWSAGKAAREFVKRYQPGAYLCEVLDGLRRDGFVKEHVRMNFVYEHELTLRLRGMLSLPVYSPSVSNSAVNLHLSSTTLTSNHAGTFIPLTTSPDGGSPVAFPHKCRFAIR